METIYFDHAATTPPRPEIVAAMLSTLHDHWGNPSSIHRPGVAALEAVERARESVAALIGADPDEIVFTGSGTESDNYALIGACLPRKNARGHLLTTQVEHHAVLHAAAFLASHGIEVTYLPVDQTGLVDPARVRASLRDDTILVSIMHASNEVGTIQPIAEIGAICRERGVLMHTDAVQTVGHLPVNVAALNIDLLSLSAHKLHGPKGVGALYLRRGLALTPLLHGGGQERKRRAGTENVPGIVGLGEAARLAARDMSAESARIAHLRDRLIHGLQQRVDGLDLTGHPTQRLPNSASFCLSGVEGESLVLNLDLEGFAASSGSACTSGALEPSHVLLAMGLPPNLARGSLRVTLGRDNTADHVDRFLDAFPPLAARLRALSPVTQR